MKRCPNCQRTFTDDLSFCAEDASALVDGGVRTLADLLATSPRVTPRRAVDIAKGLCAALDPSRSRGRVAPALTPLEVELDGESVRVTLSVEGPRAVRDAQSLEPAAPYSAPETLSEGDPVTASATVYNIAALTYLALTGDVPFAASTNAAVAVRKLLEDAPSARALAPDVPESLDALLTSALDRDASKRPQTPADLAREFGALDLTPSPVQPSTPSPAPLAESAFAAAPAMGAAPAMAPAPMSPAALAPMAAASPWQEPAPRRSARVGLWIASLGALIVVASLALVLTTRGGHAPSSDATGARPSRSSVSERPPPPAPPTPATASVPVAIQPVPLAPEPVVAPPTAPVAPSRPRPHRPRPYGHERSRPALQSRRTATGQGGGNGPRNEDVFASPSTGDPRVPSAPTAMRAPPEQPVISIGRPSRQDDQARPHRRLTRAPRGQGETGVVVPAPSNGQAPSTPPTVVPAPTAPPGGDWQHGGLAAAGGATSLTPDAATPPQQGGSIPPEPAPPLPRLQPERQPRDDGHDALLYVGLAAAVAGLASLVTGIYLLRRRARVAPPESGSWSAPMPLPQAPHAPAPPPFTQAHAPLPREEPSAIPATVAEVPAPAREPVWKGSVEQHDTVADAAWASTVQVQRSAAATSSVWCTRCGQPSPSEARFCPNDGADLSRDGTTVDPRGSHAPAQHAAPEMKPFTVGEYRCEARLGEGGMGVVYKARHVREGHAVAVKVLLLGGRAEGSLVERFRREARLAASIRHPNSVAIYDYGEIDGRLFYLAMEFIDGRSLDAVMSDRPLALARATSIVRQVCAGLAEAHAAGIVHRDLKPANVMVCERPDGTDVVKLVDFGIARDLRSTGERTMAGIVVGTPAYMAPEQARGEPGVDERADVFAVGVMTFEMLSGRHPYEARGNAIQQIVARATLRDDPPRLSAAAPAVPPSLDGVVARAITADPDARTSSVRSFADEFASAATVGAAA